MATELEDILKSHGDLLEQQIGVSHSVFTHLSKFLQLLEVFGLAHKLLRKEVLDYTVKYSNLKKEILVKTGAVLGCISNLKSLREKDENLETPEALHLLDDFRQSILSFGTKELVGEVELQKNVLTTLNDQAKFGAPDINRDPKLLASIIGGVIVLVASLATIVLSAVSLSPAVPFVLLGIVGDIVAVCSASVTIIGTALGGSLLWMSIKELKQDFENFDKITKQCAASLGKMESELVNLLNNGTVIAAEKGRVFILRQNRTIDEVEQIMKDIQRAAKETDKLVVT